MIPKLPLPIPTDPISAGVSFLTNLFKDWFGPSMAELAAQKRKLCSNAATYRPDICGGFGPWGSVNCQGAGLAVAAYDDQGRAVRCKCPLSSLWSPAASCGVMQTVKDNWYIFAGAGVLVLISMKR